MKLIFVDFKMVLTELESLFFCLIKRTKNQGFGMVVKAQFSDFLKIIAPRRFILFAPERLILSVIFCEASNKSLALVCFKTTHSSLNQKFNILIYIGKLRY